MELSTITSAGTVTLHPAKHRTCQSEVDDAQVKQMPAILVNAELLKATYLSNNN